MGDRVTTTTRTALGIAISVRVPVVLWGGPGSGKTSAVREMAASAELPCETVIASIREPSDFAGLPVIRDDVVVMSPPSWAQRLADGGAGVLFLDEVSTAPPAVQAALLRVVLERTVGDLVLPDGIAVVAAANPPEQAADGWDLAAPLANRFCHLDWTLDAREWSAGVLGGFEAAPIPVLDDDELKGSLMTIRAAVGAFVTSRPTLLHATPTDSAAAGRAWPSPRSWDTAALLLAAADLAGASKEVAAELVAGAVGAAAAAEFLAWRDDLDLPDVEAALVDPTAFVLPERGDRAYAALSALTAAVLSDNTPARWRAAWLAIAHGTAGDRGDLAVAALRTLISRQPEGAVPPGDVLRQMAPLLREAGMLERVTGPER